MSTTEPKLLRIPQRFQSVDDCLECAKKMELTNVLVLSERENGNLVFLDNGLDFAQTNWLCDRLKAVLMRDTVGESTDIPGGPNGGDAA